MPCARLARTIFSTSSASRQRDVRPCTLMIVQKLHLNGQPRPASKRVMRHVRPAHVRRRQERHGLRPELGQVVQVVVERRSAPSEAARRTSRSGPPPRRRTARRRAPAASRKSAGSSGSIARQPLTWNPPMATWTPAARNWRARSRRRGNWFVCTPAKTTSPKLPVASESLDDPIGADAGVDLVHDRDVDGDLGSRAPGDRRHPGTGCRAPPACSTGRSNAPTG